MALSVASAFISSCLDQLYSILYGTSLKHIACLNESSMQQLGLSWTSILICLHCLQVNFLNNSIGFLVNGVYGLNLPPWPLNLCILVARHIFPASCNTVNARGLRAHLVLIIFQSPRHDLKFRSRAFQSSAPRVWNSLPVSIHESQSFTTFRRHLKTFYFQSSYPLSPVQLA